MEELRTKKIYIDSRFKTSSSRSNTDFEFELKETIDLPDKCACYIDDLVIPVSYYNCDASNNKLYVRKITGSSPNEVFNDKIIELTIGQYNADQIASEIQTQFRTAYPQAQPWTCSYSVTKGIISINPVDSAVRFQILTDSDIKTKLNNTWSGPSYDANNPCSFNDTIRNNEGSSLTYSTSLLYTSGFLDMTGGKHYLYITSNFGNYNALGPRGERTIFKKVAVTANYGYNIIEAASFSGDDYIEASKQQLRTLRFQVTDAYGNVVNLNGSTISFSIVFVILKNDV